MIKAPIVSYRKARDKLTRRKFMKIRRVKTEEFQRGAWDNERVNRG